MRQQRVPGWLVPASKVDKHGFYYPEGIPKMRAEEILHKVIDTLDERGQHYTNDDERNMGKIVDLFNLLKPRMSMTVMDGWFFMICVKIIRATQDPAFKLDHFIDLAGYTALAAEEGAKQCENTTYYDSLVKNGLGKG